MGIKGLGYYLYIKTFLLMYLRHFNNVANLYLVPFLLLLIQICGLKMFVL